MSTVTEREYQYDCVKCPESWSSISTESNIEKCPRCGTEIVPFHSYELTLDAKNANLPSNITKLTKIIDD